MIRALCILAVLVLFALYVVTGALILLAGVIVFTLCASESRRKCVR